MCFCRCDNTRYLLRNLNEISTAVFKYIVECDNICVRTCLVLFLVITTLKFTPVNNLTFLVVIKHLNIFVFEYEAPTLSYDMCVFVGAIMHGIFV